MIDDGDGDENVRIPLPIYLFSKEALSRHFLCLFSVALRYTASPLYRGHWGRGWGQTGMGAGVRLDSADVKLYKSAGAVREY